MATEPTRMVGNFEFPGTVNLTGQASLPSGTVDEESVSGSAKLEHTTLTHRLSLVDSQNSTELAPTADITPLHRAYRRETVLSVAGLLYTVGSSSGTHTSIDILKSTGGTTGTSILTTPLLLTSTGSNRTPQSAVLSGTPTLLDGNLLLTKTVIGGTDASTGSQGQGRFIEVTVAQRPFNT